MPTSLKTYPYIQQKTVDLFGTSGAEHVQCSLRGLALGHGIDAISGKLCLPFASVPQTKKDPIPADTTYSVLPGIPSLTEEISNALHVDEASPINFEYVPVYLGKIRVTVPHVVDQFTVLFKWQSAGTTTTFHPAFPSDPSLLAEASIRDNPKAFYRAYGNYFVAEVEERSALTAVWTVTCTGEAQHDELVKQCETFFKGKPVVEDAASFMVSLVNRAQGAQGLATIYKSVGAKEVLLEGQSCLFEQAKNLLFQHVKDKQEIFTRLGFLPYSSLFSMPNVVPTLPTNYRDDWVQNLKDLYQTSNNVQGLRHADEQASLKLSVQLEEEERSLVLQQLAILYSESDQLRKIEIAIRSITAKTQDSLQKIANSQQLANQAAAAEAREKLSKQCANAWLECSMSNESNVWANEK
jgi:hypothetical protein